MNIYEIIGEIIDNIRYKSDITNILDNGNGTYNIYVDTSNFAKNDWITISETPNFNATDLRISDVQNDYIVVLLESGIFISDFGYIKQNAPFYDFENFPQESNYLTILNSDKVKKHQKIPLFLLIIPIEVTKNIETKINKIDSIQIFIIDKHDSLKNPFMQNKSANEFPSMRNLEERFISELSSNENIINFNEYKSIEIPYENNELNLIYNLIKITINDFEFNSQKCN